MSYYKHLCNINPEELIEEVRKRPGIYDYTSKPVDRLDKLGLWKEVGAALFDDWGTLKKSVAYDRVIQLQKKWRSIRDAYMRELRWRRSGTKTSKRVYLYFKRLTFLGGMDEATESIFENLNNESDNNHSEEESTSQTRVDIEIESEPRPRKEKRSQKRIPKQRPRKIKPKQEDISDYEYDDHHTEEVEMPMYLDTDDNDSDRLFLMSFLPEMRKLQPNIKMWMRAQIASIMQEAVTCQYNNTLPVSFGPSSNEAKNALSSSD